jgi:hypothetical protein
MESRVRIGGLRVWVERVGAGLALAATSAILIFYAVRLAMPLPIFASDEGAYLIRALWPDEVVANNPFVTAITNGVHLSLIRASFFASHQHFIVIDRLANSAAYLGGLLLLWAYGARDVGGRNRLALLLVVLGFGYYRFAFSNMAEGPFVGVLALITVATGRWWRTRPRLYALVAGLLCAVLVLIKPHGVGEVAALVALALIDAAVRGGWRRLAGQAVIFSAAFYGLGNLIQWLAEEPVRSPLAFYMSDFYDGALGETPPAGALRLGVIELCGMVAASAILAGAPIVIGLSDLWRRWREDGRRLQPTPADLMLVVLVLGLGARLAMVTIFAMKIAATESETLRLWGRYFEFFAPMIWIAAAPALARPIGRATALAAGVVTLLGLAGLMAAFTAGVVLFPWDSSVLTAFFQPDLTRAPIGVKVPYRAISAALTTLAAVAYALRARPAYVGLALTLALSVTSTWLDHVWVGPMVHLRTALDQDATVIRDMLPPAPAPVILLAPDANDGHLGFLRLEARPAVLLGPPGQATPAQLAGAQAVIVSGPEPPRGLWTRAYHGEVLSLYRPADIRS